MRILVIDTERVWRGGQQQILTLLEGLRDRVELRLACPEGSPLAERAAGLGIPQDPFSQRGEFSPRAFLRLHSLLRSQRPQILHFNTPRPILVGCLAARMIRPRPRCVASRRVVFPLSTRLSRYKYSHLLDLTLTVSESIREALRKAGVPSNRLRTVHEGVAPLPAHESKGSRSGPLWIAAVGHLSAEKGQEFLLRAGALLQADFPDFRIALIGDGVDRPRLEDLAGRLGIQRIVEFRGFREDVLQQLSGIDVLCLPSLSEGLSSALLEGMSAGLPIVATQVGGIPELVQEGVNGLLVPAADSGALAQALARLLGSSRLRSQFGESSRERVARDFSLDAKINRTLEAYRELLRAPTVR